MNPCLPHATTLQEGVASAAAAPAECVMDGHLLRTVATGRIGDAVKQMNRGKRKPVPSATGNSHAHIVSSDLNYS
jgi:hypothetical protein